MATVQVWAWIDGYTPQGDPIMRRTLAAGTQRPSDVPEHAWLAEQDCAVWRQQILSELNTLDAKSIRALREGNAQRLAEIEARASELRGVLKVLDA